MFGAFRQSVVAHAIPTQNGLLWKNPWRMSAKRKYRQRVRLAAVDHVISTLLSTEVSSAALLRAAALPTEQEMTPRDKYTVFSRKDSDVGNRKSIHKVPKWTKITIRKNPEGF